MKLINENEFNDLLSGLTIQETISGGSIANSIVGLAQLKNQVGFIGKINNDELGIKYEKGLQKENVDYLYQKKKENLPTGTCLILITPDSERTMCTFLGTAGKICENDIDEESIKKSEITFLEGYLWDEGGPKKAFEKAIRCSNKVAMSLSDIFCVKRHKDKFLDLVKNKLDITFANEQEIMELIDAKSFEEVISFTKQIKKHIVITRGASGSMVINNTKVFEFPAKQNLRIVDLTGAGDLFAAGYLHSFVNNFELEKSLECGTNLSAKVIQILGARL
jgi:fructokinase